MRHLLLWFFLLLLPPLAGAQSPFHGPARAVQRQSEALVGLYVLNERGTDALERLPRGSATHLLYAFLHLCGPGQLPAQATACRGRPDFSLAPDPRHARFDAAFASLKRRQGPLQVLASVGGWGGSDPFFHLAGSAAGRAALLAALQDFLRQHPSFDGIDIDWEHPGSNGAANGVQLGSAEDGANFAVLMRELRAGLDALGREQGRRYALTVAVNATAPVLDRIDWTNAAPALDHVFLMSYDYYGAWTPPLGHHSALQSSAPGADDSLAQSVAHLRRHGVPPRQIVAGVAMYGRGFSGAASGRPGAPRAGLFPPGGEGAMAYRDIAARYLDRRGRGRGGFEAVFDSTQQAWHLHDAKRQLYLGYDDPRAIEAKAAWARAQGLAGVFAWELGQDNGALLNAMNRGSGQRLLAP